MRTIAEVLSHLPPNGEIQAAAAKTMDHIETHNKIMVSISGGSDSDIVMDLIELIGYDPGQVVYVWIDTGFEYEATKRHLDFLEEKYKVKIRRTKAENPIPLCVQKYGVPFLSKEVSGNIAILQHNNFCYELDLTTNEATQKYPRAVRTVQHWWCADGDKRFSINCFAGLKEFMARNHPPKISDQCCKYAKKNVAQKFEKMLGCDLGIVGIRRAEGGIRATAYKSCYTPDGKRIAQFRPIFYFSDKDKREYEEFRGIVHSDCYTVYGLKRTGCACCPFGSNFERELEIVRQYEPKLYKAACAIFGPSYEYTRKYREFKEKYKAEKRRHWQIGFFDNWTEDEAQKGGEDDDT